MKDFLDKSPARIATLLLLWIIALKLLVLSIPFAIDHKLVSFVLPFFVRLKPDARNLFKVFGSIWFWALIFLVQWRLENDSKPARFCGNILILEPCAGGLLAEAAKLVFGRLRPVSDAGYIFREHFNLLTWNLGFPSSHAATAWAGALSIALLYPRIRLIGMVMAMGCSLQRIASNMHYPSDVAGGFLTGWAAFILIASLGAWKQILPPKGQGSK